MSSIFSHGSIDRKIFMFFRKHSIDWLKLLGISSLVGAETIDVLFRDSDGDILYASGLTKPTDTTDGYAKGCLFIKTDAAAGSKSLYENTGTKDSCVFNLVGEEVVGDLVLTTNSMIVGVAGIGSALAIATDSLPGRADGAVADITMAEARVLGRATGGHLAGIQITNEHVDAAAGIVPTKINWVPGVVMTGNTVPGFNMHPAAAGAGLKIHTHLATGASYDYGNEFKGESVKTSGFWDGIAIDYKLNGTGTSIMRSVRATATLTTGYSMTGADYMTQSWLIGGVFVASIETAATLNGAGVCVAGLYGGLSSHGTSTLTTAKYMTALWGDATNWLNALGTGDSSLLLLTNNAGCAIIDYGINMVSANLITTGIRFAGQYLGNVIDFSGVTYVPTGAAGPCLIRCGTYDVPLAHAVEAQSGLIRLYMETSADGASYDRGIFTCLKTTGMKGIITTAGLAEVHADATGPLNVKGCEFIAQLFDTGSNLPANAIMYGGWFKVTAIDGSTIAATAKVAPLWLDNQLYGVNASNCLEYTIWNTTGGSQPRAWAGFGTTSSGWKQLFYFDATMAAAEPFVSTGCNVTVASVPYLKVLINATQYGIPLIAI